MMSGDTVNQPYSTLIVLPPNGFHDRAAVYRAARSPILGIGNPDFCGVTLPPGHLVESACLLSDDIWLTSAHLPDLGVIATEIFTDALTGDQAMTSRIKASLLDEDAQIIDDVPGSVLAGVFASDDLLAFSPQLAFAQVTVWPPLDDSFEFYASMMADAIPHGRPLPTGLGLHCGYVADEQLITYEVWKSRRAFADLMTLGGQSGQQVIPVRCLGLYVAEELRFMA